MEKREVLLNRFFTANTISISSDLEFLDNYLVYSVNFDGNVVDENNVISFLNDENNINLTQGFVSYLSGNTTTEEYREIYYNNKKLANIFNKYFQETILSGNPTNTSIIDENLISTSGITYKDNNFNWNGISTQKTPLTGITTEINNSTRILTSISALTTFTHEQSYYIDVFISSRKNQIPYEKNILCNDNKIINIGGEEVYISTESGFTNFLGSLSNFTAITGTVHTILQCFVDLNLKINHNEYWNNNVPTGFTPTYFNGNPGSYSFVNTGNLNFDNFIPGIGGSSSTL